MTNHPRRIGRRKKQRRSAELFARGPKPRPAWAVDPAPGPSSSVRFYLATVTTAPKDDVVLRARFDIRTAPPPKEISE